MKLLASLLITASLIVGALAASTAYLAPLSLPDERLLGQTLSSPAGKVPADADDAFRERLKQVQKEAESASDSSTERLFSPPQVQVELPPHPKVESAKTGEAVLASREARSPIARAGDVLTADLLAMLRDNGVVFVKVKSFEIGRWSLNWVFMLAVVGLFGGAWWLRRTAKSALAAGESATGPSMVPAAEDSLKAARDAITKLIAEVAAIPPDDHNRRRLAIILDRLSAVQEGPLQNFIAARPYVISRMGLSGYAAVMDRFAGAERQVNRAWSAAADGYLEESESCLVEAEPLFAEAIERLKA